MTGVGEAKTENGAGKAISRRQFFAEMTGGVSVAALVSMGVAVHARQPHTLPAYAIRPPGSLEEQRFLGVCSRCGLCVQACPFDALRLGRLGESMPAGTPYNISDA